MRVSITLGLIAVAIGCNGKYEGTHAAKRPAMNRGGQGMPSKDSSAPSGDGGHESTSMRPNITCVISSPTSSVVFQPNSKSKSTSCSSREDGDRVLLCSDGLTGMLTDDDIKQVLHDACEPATACRQLVARANQAGGRDNITVVVADFRVAAHTVEKIPCH